MKVKNDLCSYIVKSSNKEACVVAMKMTGKDLFRRIQNINNKVNGYNTHFNVENSIRRKIWKIRESYLKT